MRFAAVAATFVAMSVCAVSAAPQYRERPEKERAMRLSRIDPVKAGELRVRPTFNSCGIYWGAEKPIEGFVVRYRKDSRSAAASQDGEWKVAEWIEYFPETKDYRGSIVYLDEDSLYELQIASGDKVMAMASFRTWSSFVPVAKTIEIDPDTFKAPMRISDKGTPDGWIRYTVKGGRTLNVPVASPAFAVSKAEYVVFDDMVIRGCAESFNVFRVDNAKYIRIRNCDIAGWGRQGKPDYGEKANGQLREVHPRKKTPAIINWDAAILIGRGCEGCVVERCWIHDPVSTANSWFYSHPAGPQAVGVSRPDHSTVIRYNDFIGSDLHRYNDAVESDGNFIEDGGLNRDADVYGNFMIFCNDDCIELDGGQQNVRCFQNRFEQAVSGVSIQGCMVGPSYTFDNVFTGSGDSMGFAFSTVKTSGIALFGDESCAYVVSNEFWNVVKGTDRAYGINCAEPALWYRLFGNRFEGKNDFYDVKKSPKSIERGTIENVSIKRDGHIAFPYRPVPFDVSRGMIENVSFKDGVVSPRSVKVTVTANGEGWSAPFSIAKNEAFDWFDVKPASGTLKSGKSVELEVVFNPQRLKDRHNYRGAFLVRTKDGWSRPVSVYVNTDYECPFKPDVGGAVAVYVDSARPVKGTVKTVAPAGANGRKAAVFGRDFNKNCEIAYEFNVPKDGRYFILMRGQNVDGRTWRAYGRIDDGEWSRLNCTVRQFSSWVPIGLPAYCGRDVRVNGLDLKAGRHTLTIRGPGSYAYECEGFVVTDDPGLFEPR